MNVKEIRRKGVDWINLAKYREYLKGCCERSNDPSGFSNCVEFLDGFRNCWISRKGLQLGIIFFFLIFFLSIPAFDILPLRTFLPCLLLFSCAYATESIFIPSCLML
jgi:hypothetical protein